MFSFQKIANAVISCVIAFLFLGIMCFVLFSDKFNYKNIRKVEQRQFHGQILNLSQHPIRVVESKRLYTVQPGKSSLEAGVFDADGFMIDAPVTIDKDTFDAGVFKFCDFARLVIRSTPYGDVVTTNHGTRLCKVMGDYGLYRNLNEAFDRVSVDYAVKKLVR